MIVYACLYNDGWNELFKGTLEECIEFSQKLTEEEIKDCYSIDIIKDSGEIIKRIVKYGKFRPEEDMIVDASLYNDRFKKLFGGTKLFKGTFKECIEFSQKLTDEEIKDFYSIDIINDSGWTVKRIVEDGKFVQ